MPPDDPPPGDAQLFRGPHIGRLPQLQHLAPDDPAQRGPMAQGHARDHPRESPAERQRNQHHQEDVGNPHHQIHTPRERRVHLGAQQGRGDSNGQGNHRADCGGENPNPDAQRQAGQRPGQHVPAHPVRPEGILQGGRQVFLREVGLHRPALQEHPSHRYRAQEHGGGAEKEQRLFPAVPCLHDRAAPLRIFGSTTP